jgi:Disulfide bond chaperones of the HSP33 family
MNRVLKSVILNGKARAAVIDTTDALNESIKIHGLSPIAASYFGRALSAGAYLVSEQKSPSERFSLIIGGGGPLGKIYIAGSNGAFKGFVENPGYSADIKEAPVGTSGEFVLIKDVGLKEPYVGRVPMTNGEIASDFAGYLLKSEGRATGVALGVLNGENGCERSGGVIVEALPEAGEGSIVVLEDIMENFKNISAVLKEKSAEEISEFYFGHLGRSPETVPVKLECDCEKRVLGVLKSLGKKEALSIIGERGEIEMKCDYCGKSYKFSAENVEKLFKA